MTNVAIVGCGAIVEQSYLPVLRDCPGVRCEALIDPDRSRIDGLAARYGIPATASSLEEAPASVQGVIVAVPNDLHVKVVTAAVRRGAHVLCEKPLGRTVAEVAEMVAAAAECRRGVYAAMVVRRFPAVQEVVKYRLLDLVGRLQAIDASYGFPLDWPVKSPGYYDKAKSGGGALLDFGAHLIDALLHITGQPAFEVMRHADDAETGVDAEAEGKVALLLSQGRVECTIRASRLRQLPNTIVLRGTSATLEIPLSAVRSAILRTGSGSWSVTGHIASPLPCFAQQLEDFGRAIRQEPHELPEAASQAATMAVIDGLYACRQPLTFAWEA